MNYSTTMSTTEQDRVGYSPGIAVKRKTEKTVESVILHSSFYRDRSVLTKKRYSQVNFDTYSPLPDKGEITSGPDSIFAKMLSSVLNNGVLPYSYLRTKNNRQFFPILKSALRTEIMVNKYTQAHDDDEAQRAVAHGLSSPKVGALSVVLERPWDGLESEVKFSNLTPQDIIFEAKQAGYKVSSEDAALLASMRCKKVRTLTEQGKAKAEARLERSFVVLATPEQLVSADGRLPSFEARGPISPESIVQILIPQKYQECSEAVAKASTFDQKKIRYVANSVATKDFKPVYLTRNKENDPQVDLTGVVIPDYRTAIEAIVKLQAVDQYVFRMGN